MNCRTGPVQHSERSKQRLHIILPPGVSLSSVNSVSPLAAARRRPPVTRNPPTKMASGSERRAAKRKRLDAGGDRRKLLTGEHVEVRYMVEGLTGSWHSGVVVDCGRYYRMVEDEVPSGKIIEKISVSAAIEGRSSSRTALQDCRDQIRPSPPWHAVQKSDIRYGLCVDALDDEVWWEGVIFDHEEGSDKRSVFYPDLGYQEIVTIDRLRLTQDWNVVSGYWKLRGEWSLLQLLQDLNRRKEVFPVSIMQIWHDLRTMPAFVKRVKTWYVGTHDVWQALVSELFQELWSVLHIHPASELAAPMQVERFRIFYRRRPRKNKIELGNARCGNPTLRSFKRAQQVISSGTKKDSVKTILSWLIEKNVVLPRENVFYICKDGILKKGRICHNEIKCTCCGQLFILAKFEAHAGYKTNNPCANIFLDDGRSLLQCQIEIMNSSSYKDFSHRRVKGDYCHYPSDEICSICHYGGDLILCDHCPSSFHISCLDLKNVPEGSWFCSSCKCGLCGANEYNNDIMQFTMRTLLYCDQCEQGYHVDCIRKKQSQQLSYCPIGNWFCSNKCSKIFRHLSKLLEKSNPIYIAGLSWTILRWNRGCVAIDSLCPETMAAIHTKLSIALDVLHECFVTVIEPRTQSDLSADIVFNRESELKRLNFWGFYTMLLEKGDEVVSVATFRIYDQKVAEMPLIGTRVKFRRQGMCRLLVVELEKLLYALRIERLLLPSIPQLLETWTTNFGFTKVESNDRKELLKYPILNFQEATMCQKFLSIPSVSRR